MRLYSIHPKYLDQKGLCGLWAESLLAQSCLLKGEYQQCPSCHGGIVNTLTHQNTRCDKCENEYVVKTPYYNHPQLNRFKNHNYPLYVIAEYLNKIWQESLRRNYNFDFNKIKNLQNENYYLTVTKGQLEYEFNHLQNKLMIRDIKKADSNLESLNVKINRYNFSGLKIAERTKALHYANKNLIESHPLFKVIEGKVESWEKIIK